MTRSADALHLDLEWIKVMAPFTSDDFSLSLSAAPYPLDDLHPIWE